ncbi:ABC transporter permease [Neobacillus notoginsengisoli]|uniref:ABC transporter permease n=1 Tax=Neobacillus notoginsengisoli TaxID=1578198 RepID=A0A417YIK1_9BACI|nr:ABC transporter permease [Neobacillus notoginsengisoli]RHW32843.1 ABC transporter permease [Neobacillus notoginsengisoli]
MLKKYGPLIILGILMIILSFASPYFLTTNNLTTVAIQTAVIGVITIGQLMIIVTGGIDLSLGSILAFSSVIAAMMLKSGTPLIVCLIVAILIGAIAGYVNGTLVTKFKIPAFIATLGTGEILRGSALIITNGLPVSGLPKSISVFANGKIGFIPVPIFVFALLAIIFQVMLSKTLIGRHVYALGSNVEATRLAGINVGQRTRMVYMFAGILAAIAGVLLLGRLTSAQPTAAMGYELDSIAASVIGGASFLGGVGTAWGAIVGAFIITVLKNGFTLLHVNTFFQQAATGFVLVFAVYLDMIQRTKRRGSKKKV